MKFLIIQTAFAGDVILATGLIEKLHQTFPDGEIDFLLRKGNESLLQGHPFLKRLLIWDKSKNKIGNLFRLTRQIRRTKYDHVINLQRFASSGIFTALSGAAHKAGFDKNPLSFTFDLKLPHHIGDGTHETERNHSLIADITDLAAAKPKLYPTAAAYDKVISYKTKPYICIAPASVWFTKQYPKEKWLELIKALDPAFSIFLIGGPEDEKLCKEIIALAEGREIKNLAGKLSFPETAALMQDAIMNYTNDSAPLHIASAMNAAVTAIFCSTIPAFGFGPLSERSRIAEIQYPLECRPCGLHGYMACPRGHFKCAHDIRTQDLLF